MNAVLAPIETAANVGVRSRSQIFRLIEVLPALVIAVDRLLGHLRRTERRAGVRRLIGLGLLINTRLFRHFISIV